MLKRIVACTPNLSSVFEELKNGKLEQIRAALAIIATHKDVVVPSAASTELQDEVRKVAETLGKSITQLFDELIENRHPTQRSDALETLRELMNLPNPIQPDQPAVYNGGNIAAVMLLRANHDAQPDLVTTLLQCRPNLTYEEPNTGHWPLTFMPDTIAPDSIHDRQRCFLAIHTAMMGITELRPVLDSYSDWIQKEAAKIRLTL